MGNQGYDELPVDRAISPEEAAEFKTRTTELRAAKQWHWNGNAADVYQAVELANQYPPQGAGEAIFALNGNLVAVWLYY
ncbi:hypothetical protein [Streptomyces scabiei]|uniref:hypothetical protein n=1 Tax=Streptomyces scabiei TaxID=1930 RepID=UPI000AECE4C8|nr:hypothetical protein [Streptomyces scabiei]MDX2837393.1 hypothetical protein [Streptomyces scabiei]MDX3681945.1 hypothetical protein [Streptomyces scabiei]